MKKELDNKYICSEVKYAFKSSIEALEKQIPEKPTEDFYDQLYGEDDYDEGYYYSCPKCESEVGRYSNEQQEWIYTRKFCKECGQKIGWD